MYRYTRVLKGALFALLFSLSALLPSYAAITADGPGSGVAGPRETVPEEGAQTEALWQDPASQSLFCRRTGDTGQSNLKILARK